MSEIDPKYLGIPNICFSLTDKYDERELEFSKQRLERGFDDSETWALDMTLANFIIPRLERYQEIANDFLVRDEDLVKSIDLFLEAMKLLVRADGVCTFSEREVDTLEQGLKTFPDIFRSLWW